MTRDELRAALAYGNVRAFLRVVCAGESNQTDGAYSLIVGGGRAPNLDAHPRVAVQTAWGWSSAAGAYQFMAAIPGKVKTDTWDGLERKYGPLDFSKDTQDEMAVALIDRRGALADVVAGRLADAIKKCGREWASLPGSPYGQPTRTYAQAEAVYIEYGGALEAAAVIDEPDVAAIETPQEVKPMAFPILIPILAELAKSLIPQLGGLFATTEVAQRNVAAATAVAGAIVQATGAVNLQEAADRIQNDPAALQAARQAVSDIWPSITEAGSGGIGGARAANADANQQPPWKDKTFLMAAMFYPLIAFVIVASMLKVEWLAEITPETRAGVIMFVLGTICGGFMTYFTGTSASSQKKDALLAGRVQ